MQVSATLIAAQAAAREARARLNVPQPAQQANFVSALQESREFSALPLKQAGAAAPATGAQAAPTAQPARMGQHLDITI